MSWVYWCTMFSVHKMERNLWFKVSGIRKDISCTQKTLNNVCRVRLSYITYSCTECVQCLYLSIGCLRFFISVGRFTSIRYQNLWTQFWLVIDRPQRPQFHRNMQRSLKDLLSPYELTKSTFSRNFDNLSSHTHKLP